MSSVPKEARLLRTRSGSRWERRQGSIARRVGSETRLVGAVGVHHVDLLVLVVELAYERDRVALGRPGRVVIVPVVDGELFDPLPSGFIAKISESPPGLSTFAPWCGSSRRRSCRWPPGRPPRPGSCPTGASSPAATATRTAPATPWGSGRRGCRHGSSPRFTLDGRADGKPRLRRAYVRSPSSRSVEGRRILGREGHVGEDQLLDCPFMPEQAREGIVRSEVAVDDDFDVGVVFSSRSAGSPLFHSGRQRRSLVMVTLERNGTHIDHIRAAPVPDGVRPRVDGLNPT